MNESDSLLEPARSAFLLADCADCACASSVARQSNPSLRSQNVGAFWLTGATVDVIVRKVRKGQSAVLNALQNFILQNRLIISQVTQNTPRTHGAGARYRTATITATGGFSVHYRREVMTPSMRPVRADFETALSVSPYALLTFLCLSEKSAITLQFLSEFRAMWSRSFEGNLRTSNHLLFLLTMKRVLT